MSEMEFIAHFAVISLYFQNTIYSAMANERAEVFTSALRELLEWANTLGSGAKSLIIDIAARGFNEREIVFIDVRGVRRQIYDYSSLYFLLTEWKEDISIINTYTLESARDDWTLIKGENRNDI